MKIVNRILSISQPWVMLLTICGGMLAFLGCNRPDEPMPPGFVPKPSFTQEGAMSFACEVNGIPWWANYNSFLIGNQAGRTGQASNIQVIFGGPNTEFHITATFHPDIRNLNRRETMRFMLQNVRDTGWYTTRNQRFFLVSMNEEARFNPSAQFVGDTCRSVVFVKSEVGAQLRDRGQGAIHITHLPRDQRQIAGRFWASVIRPGCDSVRIRNGIFDVRY